MSNAPPEAAVVHLSAFLTHRLSASRADGRLESASRSARSVASMAQAMNTSLRTAHTHAMSTAGLSPKRLLRIVRLHRALRHAAYPRANWSDSSYAAGYADQSHMVREFRSLLGDSPEAWRARARDSFK